MLATTNTNASKMSSNGSFSKIPQEKSGEGEGGSRWVSRVPWELLDELEAEKRKLRVRDDGILGGHRTPCIAVS